MKSKKNTPWRRLDNAAKIFPPTSGKRDPKVFRFACELREPVEPEILQTALDVTMELFPGYRSVLRHGFFWYYLEASDLKPQVRKEASPLCSPIYDRNVSTLLFDVTYFDRRISLEVYHALADGTGALQFLRALVCRYLALRHREELGETPPQPDYDASETEQMADSFQKYYDKKKGKKAPLKFAYKLKGPKLPEYRIKVIEGVMPVPEVLKLAHSFQTTVTVLFTSLLLCAIHEGMSRREEKKPVVISVPVNLRNYFASESARNFFALMAISYDFSRQPAELEQVIPEVARAFRENLTLEKLKQHMNSLIAIEKNVAARAVPLLIKDVSMRAAYWFSAQAETAAVSNVGQIKLPEVYAPYIRLFDVFTSTDKLQICMCSYRENMVVSFTDPLSSADIQKYFFRWLASHGVPVELTTNPTEEEERASEKEHPPRDAGRRKGCVFN